MTVSPHDHRRRKNLKIPQDIQIVGKPIRNSYSALFSTKKNPYRNELFKTLLRFFERGKVQKNEAQIRVLINNDK